MIYFILKNVIIVCKMSINDMDKYLLSLNSKIIHQVWFGTIPNKQKALKVYKKFQKYRVSWRVHNPQWYIIEWNKRLCDIFVKTYYPEHYVLYRSYQYEIQRCDSVRYMILLKYGGLYVDMDYYCNKSFDIVFQKYRNNFYLVQTPNRSGDYVSNSLMYSTRGHKFWKSLMIELEINRHMPIYYSKHLTVMFTTGPGVINRVYHKYKRIYNLKSWPHKYFQPYGHTEHILSLKNNSVYAIHNSNGCWHTKDSKFVLIICKEWITFLIIITIIILPQLILKLL